MSVAVGWVSPPGGPLPRSPISPRSFVLIAVLHPVTTVAGASPPAWPHLSRGLLSVGDKLSDGTSVDVGVLEAPALLLLHPILRFTPLFWRQHLTKHLVCWLSHAARAPLLFLLSSPLFVCAVLKKCSKSNASLSGWCNGLKRAVEKEAVNANSSYTSPDLCLRELNFTREAAAVKVRPFLSANGRPRQF